MLRTALTVFPQDIVTPLWVDVRTPYPVCIILLVVLPADGKMHAPPVAAEHAVPPPVQVEDPDRDSTRHPAMNISLALAVVKAFPVTDAPVTFWLEKLLSMAVPTNSRALMVVYPVAALAVATVTTLDDCVAIGRAYQDETQATAVSESMPNADTAAVGCTEHPPPDAVSAGALEHPAPLLPTLIPVIEPPLTPIVLMVGSVLHPPPVAVNVGAVPQPVPVVNTLSPITWPLLLFGGTGENESPAVSEGAGSQVEPVIEAQDSSVPHVT